MNRFIESAEVGISNKPPSRLNAFQNKNTEVFQILSRKKMQWSATWKRWFAKAKMKTSSSNRKMPKSKKLSNTPKSTSSRSNEKCSSRKTSASTPSSSKSTSKSICRAITRSKLGNFADTYNNKSKPTSNSMKPTKTISSTFNPCKKRPKRMSKSFTKSKKNCREILPSQKGGSTNK